MRKLNLVVLAFLVLGLHTIEASAQDELDLDYSISMPSIDIIQGSMAVPANLDLLTQGILKIFADSDNNGHVTQEEADALFEDLSDETKANMSLRLEDLEPLIQTSVGIDLQEPRTLEVLDMKIAGLVGPVNSSTPLAFIISFNAEFNVEDRIAHTISFGFNESYSGDLDFKFTAPSGWEVDGVSGLSDQSIEGRNVYGTPISQVDINISEEIQTDTILICVGIGIVFLVTIIIILFFILKKGKSAGSQTPKKQFPQSQAMAPAQPYQTQPPPQPAPNICKQCGSNMSWEQQYQRYYCNTCGQYR